MIYRKAICRLLLLSVVLFTADRATSQEQSTKYVPKEAFAGVLVDIPKFMDPGAIKLFPREIVTAVAKRDFGFDPVDVKSAKVVIGMNANAAMPMPAVGAIIEFKKRVDLDDHFEKLGEPVEVDGTKIYFSRDLSSYFVQPERDVVLVASTEPFALLMAASKREKTPFAKLLASTELKSDAKLIVSIEQLKPLLNRALGGLPLPEPFSDVRSLPNQVQSIAINLSMISGGFSMKADLSNYSESDAKKTHRSLIKMMNAGKEMLIAQIESQNRDSEDVVANASIAYFKRILNETAKDLHPEVKGKTVSLELKNEIAVAGVFTGLLLPAVQSAREAARRVQAGNNIKQMGLALHNYHDTHGHFPAQAIQSKKGKPLLSWRVEILPYIGREDLYKQFHLDEPWDSDHNIKLLDKMPQSFQNPNRNEQGKTNFLGVSGKGAFFDGDKGRTFADFKNGTSRTVIFVESDRFVPWTKPEDHKIDWRDPFKDLGGIRPNGFQVSFADGAVTFFSSNVDVEVLKSAFRLAPQNER